MLDAVVGPLNDAARVLKAMAAKDFTRPIEGDYAGEFKTLRNAVNAVVENVRSAVGQITEQRRPVRRRLSRDCRKLANAGRRRRSSKVPPCSK